MTIDSIFEKIGSSKGRIRPENAPSSEGSFFKRLPYKVFKRLVPYLDVPGVRNLLKACPDIRPYFGLVSDAFSESYFGFEEVVIPAWPGQGLAESYIPLFEFISPHTSLYGKVQFIKTARSYLTKHCFMYLANIPESFETSICDMARETGASILCDFETGPTYLPIDPKVELKGRLLETLELPSDSASVSGRHAVKNVNFSNLKNIKISLKSHGKRPYLKNVYFPMIELLTLLYGDIFPTIKGLYVAGQSTLPQPKRALSFIHSPENLPHTMCFSSCKTPDCYIELSDLSFVSAFGKVSVIGGPDGLVASISLSCTNTFVWKQVSNQLRSDPIRYLHVPCLENFTLETCIPDFVCPALLKADKLRSFTIISQTTGTDLQRCLLNKTSTYAVLPDTLESFVIRFLKNKNDTASYSFHPSLLKRLEKLKRLELIGCHLQCELNMEALEATIPSLIIENEAWEYKSPIGKTDDGEIGISTLHPFMFIPQGSELPADNEIPGHVMLSEPHSMF